MKLYEIDEAMEALVNQETGELLDFEAFNTLQMERTQKIENMALWVKDLLAEAKAIKAEIDILAERKKAAENKAARLKEYLQYILGGEKFKTSKCSVSYRKSTALNISDEEELVYWLQSNYLDDCLKYKDPEVSKTAVANLIKAGNIIPYARIEEKEIVVIK